MTVRLMDARQGGFSGKPESCSAQSIDMFAIALVPSSVLSWIKRERLALAAINREDVNSA